jgi:hypothetical protein
MIIQSGSTLDNFISLFFLQGIVKLLHLDVQLIAALEFTFHTLSEFQHCVDYCVLLPA